MEHRLMSSDKLLLHSCYVVIQEVIQICDTLGFCYPLESICNAVKDLGG